MTTQLPDALTIDALLKYQDDMEADLERVLLECTEEALSTIVDQAMSFSLTAASSRHLWEGAVSQALYRLGLGDDRFLSEELLAAGIGDEAYEAVQAVMQSQPEDDDALWVALHEALDIEPKSLVASGISDLELEAEVEATFRRRHNNYLDEEGRNWVEVTGTGHLPRYIRAIADALIRRGYGQQRAIATAVNTVKRWARKGPARHGGKGHVTAKTQAKAIKALLEWEAKKIEAAVTAVQNPVSLVASGGDGKKHKLNWRSKIKLAVRTGFTGVVGRLTLAVMKARGTQTKCWVSKRDGRVRPTHREADGHVTLIDQPFRVGNESLMYPGEAGKSLEETANCRCIVVPGPSL